MNAEAQQLDPMLQFFAYDHLPDRLREISAPFGQLALAIVTILPPNPERTTALRKLLEAKDCAVRARLYRFPPPPPPYPPRPTDVAMQVVPKDADTMNKPADRPPPHEMEQAAADFKAKARAAIAAHEAKTSRIGDQEATIEPDKPAE